MSSHLAHYLPFLLLIFFVCPTITVFLMSFTSTMHYVVLLISNKNLPLKKKVSLRLPGPPDHNETVRFMEQSDGRCSGTQLSRGERPRLK